MTLVLRAAAVITVTASIIGCSIEPVPCSGGFDGEVVPSAQGYASRLAAVEAWAAESPAPDTGWVETASGARVDDWVVETVQTSDGGWHVESLTCVAE